MTDPDAELESGPRTGMNRRHFIAYGLGGTVAVVALGAACVDLASRGILPGQQILDRIEGKCSVPVVNLSYVSPMGPTIPGTFYSTLATARSATGLATRLDTGQEASCRSS